MIKIEKQVVINAFLEKVFDYVYNPVNLPQIWDSLVEVKSVKLMPDGGYSGDWLFKMGGIFLEGSGKYIDIVPRQWFAIETRGAVDSKILWTFWPQDGQTRVTLTINYSVPIPVLGRLAEMIIIKMNENQADLILTNLKLIMEGS